MTKTHKKIMSIMLAAALLITCLAGCGQKEPEPEPEPKLSAEEIYDRFLHDGYTALLDYETSQYEQGREYLISELAEAGRAWYSGEPDERVLVDRVFYAPIDCGLDGEPEMVVQIGYTVIGDQYNDIYALFYIVKAFDQQLKIVTDSYDYYRTYSSINKAGVISEGGSFSAYGWISHLRYIDADGVSRYLYGLEADAGLNEPVVPSYCVPVSMQKEGYDEDPTLDFNEDGYTIYMYNFTDPSTIDYESEEDSDRFVRDYLFCFMKQDEDAAPAERYAELYKQKGVRIESSAYIESFLKEYLKNMGVPEGADSAEPADWIELTDADWTPKG